MNEHNPIHPAGLYSMSDSDLREAYAYPSTLHAPYVRACCIQSLDGSATLAGLSGGLGDDDDQRLLALLRQLADVVLVGAGTIRDEKYGAMRLPREATHWRLRAGLPAHPTLAIVSSSLQLDPTSPIFADAPVRPLILTGAHAPRVRERALREVADVVHCGNLRAEPGAILEALAERSLLRIECEGGPRLLADLIHHDALDEMCLTISPILVGGSAARVSQGGDAARGAVPMRLEHAIPSQRMLFTRWVRDESMRPVVPSGPAGLNQASDKSGHNGTAGHLRDADDEATVTQG